MNQATGEIIRDGKRPKRTTLRLEFKAHGPIAGSLYATMEHLEVDGYIYLEVERDDLHSITSRVTAKTRYPQTMAGRAYTSNVFTAVSATLLGDVRYLVRIERTE